MCLSQIMMRCNIYNIYSLYCTLTFLPTQEEDQFRICDLFSQRKPLSSPYICHSIIRSEPKMSEVPEKVEIVNKSSEWTVQAVESRVFSANNLLNLSTAL